MIAQAVEVILPAEAPALVLPTEQAYVAETLAKVATRYGGMVKLQVRPGSVGSTARADTTSLAKEIVMPSHDTVLPIDAIIDRILSKRRRFKRGVGARIWHNIYYLRCLDCGLIKIGFSRDYRLRRLELQKRSGHKNLEVLGVEGGDRWCEAQTHQILRADHVGGEWYRPTDAVMAHVARNARSPFSYEL